MKDYILLALLAFAIFFGFRAGVRTHAPDPAPTDTQPTLSGGGIVGYHQHALLNGCIQWLDAPAMSYFPDPANDATCERRIVLTLTDVEMQAAVPQVTVLSVQAVDGRVLGTLRVDPSKAAR